MRRLLLPTLLLWYATSSSVAGQVWKDSDWQTGKLVFEDRDSAFAGVYQYGALSVPLYRNYRTYIIEAGNVVYVVQERVGARAAQRSTPFIVNAPVRFAIAKARFYLLDEESKVHTTSIVKQVLKDPVAAASSETAISRGSGFVFSIHGHVLTNLHVVKGCQKVSLTFGDAQLEAEVVASDARSDLAVVKSDHTSTYLPFREDQRIKLGESVIVAGYPLQGVLASSMNLTTGTVSALAGIGEDSRVLQFSAPVQAGNSGGPLLDQSGHVVGIVVGKLSPLWTAEHVGDIPENVNFAIKGSAARDFLDSKGIEYSAVPSITALPTTTVADQVRNAVVRIVCTPAR